MAKIYKFEDLPTAPLVIDAVYEGGVDGNIKDEPLSKLVGCNNQGGFRYVGSLSDKLIFCVLYSSLLDLDWPDRLDVETGIFTYYGDNKNPGHMLHDTNKKGNIILKQAFNDLHLGNRLNIPPFFIFTKGSKGRDVVFRGLAVPGTTRKNQLEDLVAVWKTIDDQRFQNYKATFTILDVPAISREWIIDLQSGDLYSVNAPKVWLDWVNRGENAPLASPRSVTHRTKNQQLPMDGVRRQMLETIISYFKEHPRREYAFEACAVEIIKLMDQNIISCDLTRPWRDGGRDAIGKYRIGLEENFISVDFALEAKCKEVRFGSGIRDTSRLISRLKYRQFGVFVTTSFVDTQAYKEIIDDMHPVIIISGKDIIEILVSSGLNTCDSISDWLRKSF